MGVCYCDRDPLECCIDCDGSELKAEITGNGLYDKKKPGDSNENTNSGRNLEMDSPSDKNLNSKKYIEQNKKEINPEVNNVDEEDEYFGDLEQNEVQLKFSKSVCHILGDQNEGPCVLVKTKLKGENKKMLITSDKLLPTKEVNGGGTIFIYFNNYSKEKQISLDYTKKKIWVDDKIHQYGITLVEILDEELDSKKLTNECFLDVDLANCNSHLGQNIIAINDPKRETPIAIEEGNIENLHNDGFSFMFKVSSEELAVGAPIIDPNTQKVIGTCIGKEGDKYKATFLTKVLEILQSTP